MNSIHFYSLHIPVTVSDDRVGYFIASCQLGSVKYTGVGFSSESARKCMLDKLLLDSKADKVQDITPVMSNVGTSEVIRLVVLWGVLAFIVCGLMAIVAKILTN